ncbi:hypothetical protein [Humibacter sp. RRB41]|uniref:hypothetical protein n=1 Tax=Humibacter sp. RRB41 TaxID=2919946 RepID=UPI001FAA6732|nr:hypothetical protein [Humibacter sp. RRB41]
MQRIPLNTLAIAFGLAGLAVSIRSILLVTTVRRGASRAESVLRRADAAVEKRADASGRERVDAGRTPLGGA